jgi:hypothetical protein
MNPLALLSLLSLAAPLIEDVAKAESEVKDAREKLEVTRQLESYRYASHKRQDREAFVAAVATQLPKRLAFMAHPLRSARTQWEVDMTISAIEVEMWRQQ